MNFKSMIMQYQLFEDMFAILVGGTHDGSCIQLDEIKPVVWFNDTLEVYGIQHLCFDNTWAFKLVEPE